jgi:hypothetical protein
VKFDSTGTLFDGWHKVFYFFLPRFLAYLLLSSSAPSVKRYP